MKLALLWWSLLALAVANAAHARECRGVDFPEQIQVHDTNLTLNGLGIRKATFLKVNVYVAALYVAQPATGEIWGNLPQTYSMAGIINTGMNLSRRWDEAWASD